MAYITKSIRVVLGGRLSNIFRLLNQACISMSLMFILLCSCVGVIEDKNPSTTKGTVATPLPMLFDGIVSARPIANDKVEVFFYPASGLASDVTYLVNYDGVSQPVAFPGEVLHTDYRGLIKVTIYGLQMDTQYSFNVQAKDLLGFASTNDLTFTVKTFSNITANFQGVGDVDNLSGADGRNALLVKWAAAEVQGSSFVPKEIDPTQYEIVLINADLATPEAFDDTSFVEPARKVVYAAADKISSQVNGLLPGKKYYVRVQAIHYGYSLYGSDPDYKREANSNYYELETLGDSMSSLVVDLDSFDVDNAAGAAGLTTFILGWEKAQGAFSHYRVYYTKVGASVDWNIFRLTKNTVCKAFEDNYYCKLVDYTANSTLISGLEPYSDYHIYLVICGDVDCSTSQMLEYTSHNPYRTEPQLARFDGITEVKKAMYFWALDELYLVYDPPDLSSGVMDGLLVEMKARAEGPSVDTFLNHPTTANNTVYTIPVFDFQIDTKVAVRGINPYSPEQYCFSLVPYTWELGTVIEHREGEVIKCVVAEIDTPTAIEFEGIENVVYDANTQSISLLWATPSGGVYDKFVVYAKVGSDVSNFFSEAVAGNPSYYKFYVPYGENSYTFPLLPVGTYSFGVLAYFEGANSYSEFNTNLRVQEVVAP